MNTIRVVAALIRDDLGRMLVVRKRGTEAFMQPGGKRDAGEDDLTALGREIGFGGLRNYLALHVGSAGQRREE